MIVCVWCEYRMDFRPELSLQSFKYIVLTHIVQVHHRGHQKRTYIECMCCVNASALNVFVEIVYVNCYFTHRTVTRCLFVDAIRLAILCANINYEYVWFSGRFASDTCDNYNDYVCHIRVCRD